MRFVFLEQQNFVVPPSLQLSSSHWLLLFIQQNLSNDLFHRISLRPFRQLLVWSPDPPAMSLPARSVVFILKFHASSPIEPEEMRSLLNNSFMRIVRTCQAKHQWLWHGSTAIRWYSVLHPGLQSTNDQINAPFIGRGVYQSEKSTGGNS
jgi:hypothetical protein